MDPATTIFVLPPHVVDQIAAGEVIERPASVVKELVDNALDAGARTITVETQAGGRALVRVSDDGIGMSPTDAIAAFGRHATSKLRVVDDLWALVSMGFRGEALPSIASVSRLVLTTRREGDLAATRVAIDGGAEPVITEVGAPVGTTVEVTDLLWNLPARLKFLKGEATEASHVTEVVARLAMAFPTVHWKLRHNGRTALELPPERDGFARARALLGARTAAALVPVSGEEAGVRVTAYLAAPELAQTTARGVQLFVGRRAVRDRGLLHAVTMGYGELIPRGRYPVAVVLLDVPAGGVDYNVHPQKSEVRFAEAPVVAAAVRHVVQAGVASAPWRDGAGAAVHMIASIAPPALPIDGGATALADRYARELRANAGQTSMLFSRGDRPAPAGTRATTSPRAWVASIQEKSRMAREAERDDARIARAYEMPAQPRMDPGLVRAAEPAGADDAQVAEQVAEHGAADVVVEDGIAATVPGYFGGLRYLGQLDLTYFVCEADGELVLVDQHSAHERVELARLQARHAASDASVQKLLFPLTIEATAPELALVARVAPLLARVGFEAEAFGRTTLAIKAVPAGLRHGDPAQLLRKLIVEWAREPEADHESRLLAEIACHSVVRAGDRLAAPEAEALLRALDAIDLTGPAPHGRALVLRLPLAEIGRRFGR